MQFGIITLFPEMFTALHAGITGRAIKKNLLEISTWNPRDYTSDKHQTVDDSPYGGGVGMVMMTGPLVHAINAAKENMQKTNPKVIYLSPQGKLFHQAQAENLATQQSVIFIAGRYEGIDERIIENLVDEEWSIGDYILSGGEFAAMNIIDATSRLLPGVVGREASVNEDSLTSGLLKYPQYTRPEMFQSMEVPPVLLSGNHQHIKTWRLKQSLGRTWLKRPDLLKKKTLSSEETNLLSDFIEDFMQKNPRKSQ